MTEKPLALHLAEVFEIEGDYRTAAELRRLHGVNAPPQREWQGLTNEEIEDIRLEYHYADGAVKVGYERAIEAKLKEKNAREGE
jgi:hypothetical protein